MNFFKSMLSDDPEPENMADFSDRSTNQPPNHPEPEEEFTNLNLTSSGEIGGGGSGSGGGSGNSGGGGGNSGGGGGLWSFGDLVKTITTRSETVLETYRRDLKEFGSGLRKESDLFREVASRAVKELPSSIEVAGASAIDGVLKSTAEIISQGKEALLLEQPSSDVVVNNDSDASESVQNRRLGYSRFDSQLNAIQIDSRTYCLDPEDLDDYSRWKLEFVLSDKEGEIEKLIGDNGDLEVIYRKVVPNEVDDGSFWCRYFYRVHKLKQQEDMRANFVRRSLTADDEEELSWDVDEEDEVEEEKEEEPDRVKPKVELERKSEASDDRVRSEVGLREKSETGDDRVKSEVELGEKSETSDDRVKSKVELGEKSETSDDRVKLEVELGEKSETSDDRVKPEVELERKSEASDDQKVELERKSDEDLNRSKNGVVDEDVVVKNPDAVAAIVVDKNNNNAETSKPSSSVNSCDEKVVESVPVPKTDENNQGSSSDIEWDEIEDLGEHDEKKASQGDDGNKTPKNGGGLVVKPLNDGGEDDEDLSWDIEDDDEPVKSGK